MKPNDTYPPAFVPLTDEARKRAYTLLSNLILSSDREAAVVLCDIAMLAGHPNYPLGRPQHTPPTDPIEGPKAAESWGKSVRAGRTVLGPAYDA